MVAVHGGQDARHGLVRVRHAARELLEARQDLRRRAAKVRQPPLPTLHHLALVRGGVVRGGGGYPPAPPQLASCVPPPASCVRCVRHTTSCVRICCPHLKHFFNNINIFIYVIDLDPFFGSLALAPAPHSELPPAKNSDYHLRCLKAPWVKNEWAGVGVGGWLGRLSRVFVCGLPPTMHSGVLLRPGRNF